MELSFLTKDEQENLRITMESEDATPSLSQAQRMKKLTLLTSGRLNAYLADIDRKAQERMERLTEQMKRARRVSQSS